MEERMKQPMEQEVLTRKRHAFTSGSVWQFGQARRRARQRKSLPQYVSTVEINNWINGTRRGESNLIDGIYDRLCDIAHSQLRRGWRCDHVETTELVSELYLKLQREKLPKIQNRSHFFAICALLSRQILIGKVRNFLAQKCGGSYQHTSIHESMQLMEANQEILLQIDEAMNGLQRYDEFKYLVASLRIYLGFTIEEIASALDVSTSTVKRNWKFASAWLSREIGQN